MNSESDFDTLARGSSLKDEADALLAETEAELAEREREAAKEQADVIVAERTLADAKEKHDATQHNAGAVKLAETALAKEKAEAVEAEAAVAEERVLAAEAEAKVAQKARATAAKAAEANEPKKKKKGGLRKLALPVGTANCNINANFWGSFLLKMQRLWRIAPEK